MLIDPLVVGEIHAEVATEVRRVIAHYRELQDVIALLGMEELGAEDRRLVGRARRLIRFLTQPLAVTEAFTGVEGRSVALADTVAGCRAILAGECDDWLESSLYMVGTLEEARAKEEEARRRGAAAVTFWVGAAERPEFLRQNRLAAECWQGRGVKDIYEPGRNHFTVVAGLTRTDSPLVAELLN